MAEPFYTLVDDNGVLHVRATCRSNADIRTLCEALARCLEKPFASYNDVQPPGDPYTDLAVEKPRAVGSQAIPPKAGED